MGEGGKYWWTFGVEIRGSTKKTHKNKKHKPYMLFIRKIKA
jgi:hypothetical protein